MEKVIIFDTTLRDGEQSPGATLNIDEKIEIAKQLAKLGVDVIEAGFPVSSPGDFNSVKMIAQKVKGPIIAGLARAHKKDIDAAWEAVKYAEKPRIHTFIATSDIHLEYKLRKTREEVLKIAVEMVSYAKSLCKDIEFSAEDAGRTDPDYLCQVVEAVIDAGATTVNIPDTVGYTIPEEFGALIAYVKNNVPNIDKAIISVHCHNDLGMATANTIAAISNGARQVECTVNGLGERAGNCSLEEIAMILKTRKDKMGLYSTVDTTKIYNISRLVSNLTGMLVQPNKAIVGANAFAHEAGIHQDGILKERSTYEIMKASDLGIKEESKLVLGKHSGRHAFSKKLKELGHDLSKEQINKAFIEFKNLADKKKEIFDEDLEVIAQTESGKSQETWTLSQVQISSGNISIPTASVQLKNLKTGEIKMTAATGTGPVDAIYQGIENIMGVHPKLTEFSMLAVTAGIDAQAEVTAKILYKGKTITGRGASTDIIVASTLAYINALNRALNLKK